MMTRPGPNTDRGLAARVAALASAGAALIHFAVASDHMQEWVGAGVFFVCLAAFQLIWSAVIVIRPTAAVLGAGIAVNVGSVALWALSRTSGAPVGPHAGEPEAVQAAGLCALMLQTYVVMAAGWIWYRGRHTDQLPGFGYGMVLTGAGSVIAVAATLGMASGLQHTHVAPAVATEPGQHTPKDVGAPHEPTPARGPAPGYPASVPLVQAPLAEHHEH